MRVRAQTIKRLVYTGLAVGGGVYVATVVYPRLQDARVVPVGSVQAADLKNRSCLNQGPLPSRKQIHEKLQTEQFDVLVIGGGATGAGVALDAVSRGLKTALVEKFDYSAGTSSRSTKLIHGGVRYLQKAVFNLDREQYRMVTEALAERANLLAIAPHLAYSLPIMLPVYKWWLVPYFWAGIKMYDFVAGRETLKSSYYLSKKKALELFPMLKKDRLVGALVYYDGQHDDARMNISIAITAIRMGGSLTNHVEVLNLLKETCDGKEVIYGAHVRDNLTGKEFDIRAKSVINATGPYTDSIRQMSDPSIRKICQPSSGVHIVLPDYYSPDHMGLLDPSTSDGRVIFFLPWQKVTIAGTTDSPCDVTDYPQPTEKEIQFILNEVRNYLSPDVVVRRGDVLSAWSGLRPLVADPNKADTQSVARNHIIEVSDNKLITIAGGKWTTYRHMAEETVDKAIEVCGLSPKMPTSQTNGLLLDGAHGWSPTLYIRLVQDFGLEIEVAKHLANTYGDKAFKVAKLANLTGKRWPVLGKRLTEEYPYIEAEVVYAVREYACSIIDVIARRTRLAFLNIHAAQEALPRIADIMAEQLGWSKAVKKEEMEHAQRFLRREMGMDIQKAQEREAPINFTKEEINMFAKRFKSLDSDNKGYITVNDLRKYFKKSGERVTEDQLHDILSEVDLNKNAQVDLGEFLQLMSALRSGVVSNSRLAMAAELSAGAEMISVERSGGGA